MIKNLIITVLVVALSYMIVFPSVHTTYEIERVQLAADDYVFNEAEWVLDAVIVVYHKYPDREALKQAAMKFGYSEEYASKIGGFTDLSLISDNICQIHMIDSQFDYSPALFGHEVTHCFYGQFHIDNSSRGVEGVSTFP